MNIIFASYMQVIPMLGSLGKTAGSVQYDYPLPITGVSATIVVYPRVLHQVKMRMRGGWPLFKQQKGLTGKGNQLENIIEELEGLE